MVESLPSWERGLKQGGLGDYTELVVSLPSWERGLKRGDVPRWFVLRVAPLVGAWIETI